jgi:hypothetical protein
MSEFLVGEKVIMKSDTPKILYAFSQRSTTVVQFTCNEQVAGSNPVVGFQAT